MSSPPKEGGTSLSGEANARFSASAFSGCALGPADGWPQSLRTALSICLGSPSPALLFWGTDLILLGNDAFCAQLGEQRLALVGRPVREVWPTVTTLLA